MVEKYGRPGQTDNEGFDPYADTVGPGIYGGIVKRDPGTGEVVIGRQYQNHNPRPGPVYAGGGYTPINNALRKGEATLRPLLDKYPDLVDDVSTGGARPLHMCGMGRDNQHAAAFLIERGADIEALDTYGMTPLHRMASNNLPAGARALLEAGADPDHAGGCSSRIAKSCINMSIHIYIYIYIYTRIYIYIYIYMWVYCRAWLISWSTLLSQRYRCVLRFAAHAFYIMLAMLSSERSWLTGRVRG
ncbi:unnamed protein product [Prorocentrum cordatum]|uniref:Uncharacterized protein n=1 Tax=Prorocentrum cordatum TaxID=2364126 RepID=A0ABN9SN35_9DINO|nr:unnamed protein product [Polarella glacialis]